MTENENGTAWIDVFQGNGHKATYMRRKGFLTFNKLEGRELKSYKTKKKDCIQLGELGIHRSFKRLTPTEFMFLIVDNEQHKCNNA